MPLTTELVLVCVTFKDTCNNAIPCQAPAHTHGRGKSDQAVEILVDEKALIMFYVSVLLRTQVINRIEQIGDQIWL